MVLAKNTYVNQWNKILKKTNINTCNYSHLIFDEDSKNIHWEKEYKTNSTGKTECPLVKE